MDAASPLANGDISSSSNTNMNGTSASAHAPSVVASVPNGTRTSDQDRDQDHEMQAMDEDALQPEAKKRRVEAEDETKETLETQPEVNGVDNVENDRIQGANARESQDTDAPCDGQATTEVNTDAAAKQAADDVEMEGEDADMDMDDDAMAAFHAALQVDQEVDVYCLKNKEWLAAKIVGVQDGTFRVHFMGWNKKTDERISTLGRVAPRASTAAKRGWEVHELKLEKARIARKKKMRKLEEMEAEDTKAATTTSTEHAVEVDSGFVAAGETRSGRRITKRVVHNGEVKRTTSSPAKKRSAEAIKEDTQSEQLCAICDEVEDEHLTEMLFCDGGCLSSYHLGCLGLDAVPSDEKWLCEQCRTNEQVCFLCGRNGTIHEKGGVFRCSVQSCGKYFHQRCISAHPLSRRFGKTAKMSGAAAVIDGTAAQQAKKVDKAADANPGEDATQATVAEDQNDEFDEMTAAFRCPRHICSVCENPKRSSDLMFCLKCPESYHTQCVPPSARYNNLAMLCSKHDDHLPHIPNQMLLDLAFDSVTVDSILHLPTLFLPKEEPLASSMSDCHHFRLPSDLLEHIKMQPPTFRRLGRSIYTFKQTKEPIDDMPMCVCKDHCGDDCINRLSFTECFGPAPTPGQPFQRNEKNRESNCPLGEECGNRALHQRMYPRFERFHTTQKGWGLRMLESVKAGQLVIEYVGEVINEQEKDRRLAEHAREHPEDKNMYIMELSNGVYIDARHKGSDSRFINHSCDPNCHLLKWNVRGVNRIAITALRDIAAGEELSYDYQFHTNHALDWRCYCGAKKCRGTMAPQRLHLGGDDSDDDEKHLTKKELKKKRKRALMQEKLNVEKDIKQAARRLSVTAEVSKAVTSSGPVPREMLWAKNTHVFLKRNALTGFDFYQRRQMTKKRISAAKALRPGRDPEAKRERMNGKHATKNGVVKDSSEVSTASDMETESAESVEMEVEVEVDMKPKSID